MASCSRWREKVKSVGEDRMDVLDGAWVLLDAVVTDADADPDVRLVATEVASKSHGSKLMLSEDFISLSDSEETRKES